MADTIVKDIPETEFDAAILHAVVESSRCEGIEIDEARLLTLVREGIPESDRSVARNL